MGALTRIAGALRRPTYRIDHAPVDYDRALATRALPHVSDLDQQILTRTFGLDGGQPEDLDLLAAHLHMPAADVAWRQASALLVAGCDRRRTRCPAA